MRSLKRPGRDNRSRQTPVAVEPDPQSVEAADDGDEDSSHETYEMFRVICPDCARPIALLADEDVLPEHALCPSPWDPFGLTVCSGTGRGVTEAAAADDSPGSHEQDAALLLTLPATLDWRTQPFSHAGGHGARPLRVPSMRLAG
ncbi:MULTISPECIES: hypothetical protein [Streptomyces]|uniref:Uncharacterized protein n=1 Tax=Streptomyces lycii TaxID=2654337 RepID=A0ABQ7FQY3_9ACTN|nr:MULTISPECIES: hypothetical protein [Streptomyces]KAF4410870.1 hypothetical protein GCU69_01565 [Streptomyces lycii]PGH51566.1 hypothetical protein CRI70_05990 [Streptomyces sp. Ru87]